jgi:hypothetical protein
MIFSCVVAFKRKKKKIPDLSLPPCVCFMLTLIWKALLQNITVKTQKYCGNFINPAKKFEKFIFLKKCLVIIL